MFWYCLSTEEKDNCHIYIELLNFGYVVYFVCISEVGSSEDWRVTRRDVGRPRERKRGESGARRGDTDPLAARPWRRDLEAGGRMGRLTYRTATGRDRHPARLRVPRSVATNRSVSSCLEPSQLPRLNAMTS